MYVSTRDLVWSLILVFAVNSACAQSVQITSTSNNASFSGGSWLVPADLATANPDVAGGRVFDLFITTGSDLLVIDAALTVTTGTWFNSALPGAVDDQKLPAALEAVFPELRIDSWLRVPRSGFGRTTLDAEGTIASFFDTRDDGPLNNFHFGRITVIPDENGEIEATLVGEVQTAAVPFPTLDQFTYQFGVPEPSSMGLLMTALLGGLAIVRRNEKSRRGVQLNISQSKASRKRV